MQYVKLPGSVYGKYFVKPDIKHDYYTYI